MSEKRRSCEILFEVVRHCAAAFPFPANVARACIDRARPNATGTACAQVGRGTLTLTLMGRAGGGSNARRRPSAVPREEPDAPSERRSEHIFTRLIRPER